MKIDNVVRQEVDGVYKFTIPTPLQVGAVNVYLVEGETLTLFDAGYFTDTTMKQFEQALNETGFSLTDIEQVVLTHHHVDHVGLLRYFSRHHPIPVYGHAYCQPWLANDEAYFNYHTGFFEAFYSKHGAPQTDIASNKRIRETMRPQYTVPSALIGSLDEGDAIPGLSKWQVFYTPGHAQSHLCFYRSQDQVMIAGDHLIGHISSNAIVEPPPAGEEERPKTLIQYQESMKKVYDLSVTTVLSGHGEEIRNHRQLIERRLKATDERVNHIHHLLIEQGEMTAFQLSQAVFPKVYQKEFHLTMSEVIGHLDILLDQNRISEKELAGVILYSAN